MNQEQAVHRLRDVSRLKHLAWSTEQSYVTWLKRYCLFLRNAHQDSPTKRVEAFLTGLAHEDLSASSQNQAFSALLFFYRDCCGIELQNVNALRAKRPVRERYAPSFDEVKTLLSAVRDSAGYPTALVAHLIYGCGLRVSEPLDLRIKDVCLKDSRLIIRQAKGAKDRVVPIPCSLITRLSAQVEIAKAFSAQDIATGLPVALPGRLDKKYPRLPFTKEWAYVFPARSPCNHPRTGQLVRYRMLDTNVQRCVRAAVLRADLNPMITPHCLRHAFATHLMQSGVSVRDIQVLMGHKSLETTMGYLHDEAARVVSPIERMNLSQVV